MNYITMHLKDEIFPRGDFYKENMSNETAADWMHSYELIVLDWENDHPYYNALHRKFGKSEKIFSLNTHVTLEQGDTVLVFSTNLPLVDKSEIFSARNIENATFTFSLYTIL